MYYDKRIRYLSYYESDIKLQNAGYVKFQVRDSLCQMIVYVKGPRLMGSGEAAVYLLSRKQEQPDGDGFYMGRKDSRLQKHLLGNLTIYNGQGHCAVRMNAENMADSGLRYDEICGIKIELHEYQYLESQWSVVNFMPQRKRADNSENVGYRLREPQSDGRGTEEGRRGSAGNNTGRRWQSPQGGMREEWPDRRKDSGEKTLTEKEPVKVDLIVTPVSENLRVEKLVKEEATQEEITETEARTEVVYKVADDLPIEEEDSMQGMLEREVRREEARSGGMMPSAQIEQTGKEMSSAKSTQEEQAEQTGQTERVISSVGSIQEEQPEQIERTGQMISSAGSAQEEQPERFRQTEQQIQNRQSEQQAETGQEEQIVWLRQNGGEEQPKQPLSEESLQEAADLNTEPEIQPSEQELQPDKWEQLRKTFPVVHPIREEEEYLKIAPKDFVIFTEKYQELVHNSFLLHGYYNYKHLILGKKEKEGRVIYYLGVPGTFHEREKTVAVMFGFEAFDGKREPAENGDFGYYLRRVEI